MKNYSLKEYYLNTRIFRNSSQWQPLSDNQLIYSIRNEDNRKQLLINAHFHCFGNDQGIVLKNMAGKAVISSIKKRYIFLGKPIMIVGLPNHSTNSLGKLMHPTSATMYKVSKKEHCKILNLVYYAWRFR